MFARRDTLVQALNDLETGGLPNAEIIVVSRGWWESLSTSEQTTFRTRADRVGVTLNVDDQLSAHYVEVRAGRAISGCQASTRSSRVACQARGYSPNFRTHRRPDVPRLGGEVATTAHGTIQYT